MSYLLSRPSIKARSDPSFINYPESEDIPEELPYPQEYDYLWTEERNSRYEANGILDLMQWFSNDRDRQGIIGTTGTLTAALVAGLVFSGLLLLVVLIPVPRLESDYKCGITTGGQVIFFRGTSITYIPFTG